jgi:hypothetical protein
MKRGKKKSKKRKETEKDLLFYLEFWKYFAPDSREKFQREIDKLIEELKEMD